ncbi:membrane-associating domain-containing protein [Paraphoma chrysanthemicola]|nr:membrane-associating domain-containing protein [Paraphoma chrysanthemicola]
MPLLTPATLLRLTQSLLAIIALSLIAYLINTNTTLARTATVDGPLTRLIYTLVIAAISIATSLLLLVTFPTPNRGNTTTPTKPSIASLIHPFLDLLLATAWFASFAVLHDWYDDVMHCGSSYNWASVRFWGNVCGIWGAVQAFAFLSGVLWGAGLGVGVLSWMKMRKGGASGEVVVDGDDASGGNERKLEHGTHHGIVTG